MYSIQKLGGASARTIYHIPRQRNQSARIFKIPERVRDHPEVIRKLDMVIRAEEVGKEKRGATFARCARLLGVSRSSLFSWRKSVMSGRWHELISRSRSPRRARGSALPRETIDRFVALRRAHPGLGARKIAAMLRREGIGISFPRADRLTTRLLKERRIVPARGRFVVGKRSNALVIRQPKPEPPEQPGDVVEADSLHLRKGGYRIAVIDVVSRVVSTGIYPSRDSKSARAALRRARETFPFAIRRVQTDRGSEFRGERAKWMEERGIRHHILPPRSPKLNGHVERMQGVWRQEFWRCYAVPSCRMRDLVPVARKRERIYNHARPHGALGYLAPMEALTLRRGVA